MKTILFYFRRLLASKVLCAVVIFAAAFIVYKPALSGEFIWDDGYLVGENPFFKSPVFIFEVFRRYLFLDSFSLYYRPVQNISYMLDYWLWNQNSFGYHVSNVCFHAASAFLLYLALKRLLAGLAPANLAVPEKKFHVETTAFLVALIWVVHPIHNAAVAYIAGRADSLASLFSLSAWLLWFACRDSKTKLKRVATALSALALALLALCSKEIAFVWLVLFFLHACIFERTLAWKNKVGLGLSLLTVIGLYWELRHLPGARNAVLESQPAPFSQRMILMLRALGDYAGLIFFPAKLHMERIIFIESNYATAGTWAASVFAEYLSILGLIVLGAFTFLCYQRWPGQKVRILGVLWFVVGFLPISNLFPLNAQSAEHWIYMPSIGFLVFLAGCIMAFPAQARPWCALSVSLAVLALGTRTAYRADDWSSSKKFLTRTIQAGGGTPRIHVNLASALLNDGNNAEAEKILRETLRRFPEYGTARIALGLTLEREGKKEEAEQYLSYDKAEADKLANSFPDTWKAALNLAHLRHDAGKLDESLSIIEDAVHRYPGIWELQRYQSSLTMEKYGPAEALKIVQSYLKEAWWNYDAQMTLGKIELACGNNFAAVSAFRDAARLDIHGVEPFHKIAMIELALNKPEEAFRDEKEAIRRDPSKPLQYVVLASILDRLDRKEESNQAMAHADELCKSVTGT